MNYTITEITQAKGLVVFDITFDDGTKYHKRMMADLTSPESLKASIEAWAVQYDKDRPKGQPADLSKMLATPLTVGAPLPKALATTVSKING